MSDFITNLSQRVLGTAPLVRPSFPSLFAPQRGGGKPGEFTGSEIGTPSVEGMVSAGDNVGDHLYGSAEKVWSEDGEDLHPSSPTNPPDRVENRAGLPVHDPVPERLSARRSLLPPLPPSSGEELPESRQGMADDPFSFSRREGGAHNSKTTQANEGIPSGDADPQGREEDPKGLRRRENRDDRGLEGRSRGRESVRGADKEPDRLIARTIERTISESDEKRSKSIGPRRLVAADRMREESPEKRWDAYLERDEKAGRGEAFAEDSSPLSFDSASVFAEPDRAFSPDILRGSEFGETEKENRSDRRRSSGRGKLLVPNHTGGNERGEAGEGMILPSSPVDQSEKESPPSRTINVTIGRIEVRGMPERKSPPTPARQTAKKGAEPAPVMSLDDYLKRYNGRGG